MGSSDGGSDLFDVGSMESIPLVRHRSVSALASPRSNAVRDLQLLETTEMSRLDAMRLAVSQAGKTKDDKEFHDEYHLRSDPLGLYGTTAQVPTQIWQTIQPNRMGASERTMIQKKFTAPPGDVSNEPSKSTQTSEVGIFWIALWDSIACRPDCKFSACRDLWSCDEEEDFRDGEDVDFREGITMISSVPTFRTRLANDFSDASDPWNLALCCSRQQ